MRLRDPSGRQPQETDDEIEIQRRKEEEQFLFPAERSFLQAEETIITAAPEERPREEDPGSYVNVSYSFVFGMVGFTMSETGEEYMTVGLGMGLAGPSVSLGELTSVTLEGLDEAEGDPLGRFLEGEAFTASIGFGLGFGKTSTSLGESRELTLGFGKGLGGFRTFTGKVEEGTSPMTCPYGSLICR